MRKKQPRRIDLGKEIQRNAEILSELEATPQNEESKVAFLLRKYNASNKKIEKMRAYVKENQVDD
jgi:uncharacterized protein YwgA